MPQRVVCAAHEKIQPARCPRTELGPVDREYAFKVLVKADCKRLPIRERLRCPHLGQPVGIGWQWRPGLERWRTVSAHKFEAFRDPTSELNADRCLLSIFNIVSDVDRDFLRIPGFGARVPRDNKSARPPLAPLTL